MQRFFEHTTAAFAAILIVAVSFGNVITVPPASAAPVSIEAPVLA